LAVALNTRWATAFLTATLAVASAHAQTPPLSFDTAQATQAVALLADAPSHGLDAADYGVAALQQALPLREHSP
jgi:hypothetical protein